MDLDAEVDLALRDLKDRYDELRTGENDDLDFIASIVSDAQKLVRPLIRLDTEQYFGVQRIITECQRELRKRQGVEPELNTFFVELDEDTFAELQGESLSEALEQLKFTVTYLLKHTDSKRPILIKGKPEDLNKAKENLELHPRLQFKEVIR